MTAETNLERRIAEYYASEQPLRAPDRVLLTALATIDTTRQRRGIFAPRRFTTMPTYAKLVAAVAAIAVVAFGVWQLAPGREPGAPSATATPSPLPTAASSPTVAPTEAPYEPPPLTETFTSDRHGISISYPAGWTTQPATVPWTTGTFVFFREPAGDFIYDPTRPDHLFLGLASAPLDGVSFEDWVTAYLASLDAPDCEETEPIVVDGANGVRNACQMALITRGGRGYAIVLYTSGEDADLQAFDGQTWFAEILATVQLRPRAAVDS